MVQYFKTRDPGIKMVEPHLGSVIFLEKGGAHMYAILEVGGKQYKVAEGESFETELVKNIKEGEQIVIDKVLAVRNNDNLKIGSPYLDGAKVTATLVKNGRYKKVITVKFRRRKGYHRVKNHRQWYSMLKVEKIEA